MAVLQITKRLLSERGEKRVYPALDEALDLAAPKDRARAWWSAHRAIRHALPLGYQTIGDYTNMSSTTSEDVIEVVSQAILSQGRDNIKVAKGKRP